MYPLNELSDTLTKQLWERANEIQAEQGINNYDAYKQLQRDVVTLIMDGLGELGESPAQKRESPHSATLGAIMQREMDRREREELDYVDGALDHALWAKAAQIAHDKQLDSEQRRSLHAHMRDGIEIGLDAFRKGE